VHNLANVYKAIKQRLKRGPEGPHVIMVGHSQQQAASNTRVQAQHKTDQHTSPGHACLYTTGWLHKKPAALAPHPINT
jgi:hypothetical protein